MNKPISIADIITIDSNSKTPKYRQIISALINAIEHRKIKKGDRLPSINELSEWFYLSRDTAEKAYKELKKQGVLTAVPGKGFYVDRVDVKVKHKVFLLFNKLSAHKKAIYDSFVSVLGDLASIDFYIYNNDFRSFETLILNSLDKYSHYVIMPHFRLENTDAHIVLNKIPEGKLLLMDAFVEGLVANYSAVYQNYEQDIYKVLTSSQNELAHYQRLVLVFPEASYHPKTICKGFQKAAGKMDMDKLISNSVSNIDICKGDVLILVEENELVEAIKKVRAKGWKIGRDIGLISYNETSIKEVLADGISVISTDFAAMGKKVAELILTNKKAIVENPFKMIRRKSF